MKTYPPRTHRKPVRARIPADDGRGTPQFSTFHGSLPSFIRYGKVQYKESKPWRDRKGEITIIRPD